ncbi:hypothetical protein [Haloferax volcanii]|uniref:hypothetical protein n=1 Tax=Haloferax volcanii TaxID=2246 RepID=UPI0014728736|nr:hypothetical protein [Haloferax alexandrinus]
MQEFAVGDWVRVDIPDVTDPDHEQYHGMHGRVVAVLDDDAGVTTGEDRDSGLFRVEFASGEKTDFRWRDLRPPIDDPSES